MWISAAVLAAVSSFALLFVASQAAVLVALVPVGILGLAAASRTTFDRRALGLVVTWAGLIAPFVVVEARSVENVQAGGVTALNIAQGVGPAILFAAAWLTCRTRIFPLRGREKVLLGFGLVCLLSTMWSVKPLATALRSGQLVVVFLLLILLVRQVGPAAAVVRHIVGAVYVALLAVMIGLALNPGAALEPEIVYDYGRRIDVYGSSRLEGVVPFIHPDLVGLLAAAALLTLVAGVGPRWAAPLPRRVLIGVGSCVALVLSGTRSALVLLAIGLVVLAVLDRRSRSRVLTLAATAVVALLLISPVQHLLLDHVRRGQDTQTLATLTGRTVTWDDALTVWGERPLTGFGYYSGHRFLDFAAGRNLSNLDSMYIETLVDTGLVGLIALVGFLASGLASLVRSQRSSPRSVSIAILVAALVGAAVNPSMQTPGVALILAGSLLLAPWVPGDRHRVRKRRRRTTRSVATTGASAGASPRRS